MTALKDDTEFLCAAELSQREIPRRRWIVPDYIPDRTVTMLAGDGGTGKSILALQLAVAVATGTEWIGLRPMEGVVLYVSAEDDVDEVHRRLADICAQRSIALSELSDLHVWDRAGRDAVLARPDQKGGGMVATDQWGRLRKKVADLRPSLVIIDTLADIFGGNENDRAQTRAFVGMLRGLTIEFDLGVLLLSHPSVAGMSSGSGTSGSTGWSNSMRSRLYLETVKDQKGVVHDPLARVLTTKKANYAAIGNAIWLRWQRGAYLRQADRSPVERMAANKAADEVFLELLSTFQKQGRPLSALPSSTYAPAVFAGRTEANGYTKKVLAESMERLLATKRIKIVPMGPPSKPRPRLVLEEPDDGTPTMQ
jgi:RecA-family ATPase